MSSRLLCCTGSLDGGGSERQLWQLATRIDPALFDSQIYLLARRGPYLYRLPETLRVHAFDDSVAPSPPANRFTPRLPGQIHRRQVAHLVATLRRERIDVVYDRTFHMTLVTAAACRQTRTPRVSVIVSPPSRDLVNSRERFKWFKRRLLAQAYGDPRAMTVAVSAAVADDAAAFYGLRRQAIRVVENPVDITAIEQQAQRDPDSEKLVASKSLELPESHQHLPVSEQVSEQEVVRVVAVGRLSREKGQQTLLFAVADLLKRYPRMNIQLDLIGDGPDCGRLQALIKELSLGSHVRLVGFQSNPYPWMQRANLVCIASVYEGLPNVALEAMALGRPLLATACSPSLTALVGADQARGGLVPVGDARQLADQIYDCSVHKAVWLERAARARLWVAEHHGIEQYLQAVAAILQESLKLRPRRGTSP